MLFKWKESYSCNVEEIDNQHKKLFEIGSRLYDIATLEDKYDHYDEMMDILNELKEYTIYHFTYEENLMKEAEYKDFDIHKIEHDFFIKKINKINANDFDQEQGQAAMKIITFVADWVSAHILKTDFKYKPFFTKKGIC